MADSPHKIDTTITLADLFKILKTANTVADEPPNPVPTSTSE